LVAGASSATRSGGGVFGHLQCGESGGQIEQGREGEGAEELTEELRKAGVSLEAQRMPEFAGVRRGGRRDVELDSDGVGLPGSRARLGKEEKMMAVR
jgi:hypothetical protein